MKSRFCAIALCLIVICAGLAAADSIELRNGRHVQGKYVGGTSTVIGFMTGSVVEYFATADVLALIFDRNPDSPLGGVQPESTMPQPMKREITKEKVKLRQANSAKANHRKRPRLRQVSVAGPDSLVN